ncbi:hypothetical protein, conserved [Trypanosoma brucei brucei TREU927]|uniref:Guanine nucleotide-binding protein subunit beta-like protein n=1 Tax=Trypanosoma brucei brucei (strain 927/4 GUTat10.1) TaxID=185431 RepID=Q381D7_TRYB2|nr:hypothetical protein, conserved [Trypanosoma brucei brucei TREU927]EAN80594.1 hypothetical protein, conserved [Trypanosoma brucei brucei TREU927]
MPAKRKGKIATPPVSILETDGFESAIFRRLVAAPDYSLGSGGGEILATWSLQSVPVIAARNVNENSLPRLEYNTPAAWVKLPYPAIDIAWCPFKEGDESASFLTATNSLPLQLWDVEDGALRASYCCSNTMGMPVHPHSILWSTHRELIAAGYGEPHDDVHIRLYDVLREGNCVESSYRSPCSKGIVSALADGPTPYSESLILAGFIRNGNVDIIDTRHCGAAAVLRGLRSGVVQILPHPTVGHLVYAAGRLGENRIVCWDIRKSNDMLLTFERTVRTQQPAMFGFVRRKDGGSQRVDLVSATHSGGVLVFDACTNGKPRGVQSQLGPTAGLTVLSHESPTVAVTVGEARYIVRDRYEENAASPSHINGYGLKRSRSQLRKGDLDTENDSGDEGAGVSTSTLGAAIFNV